MKRPPKDAGKPVMVRYSYWQEDDMWLGYLEEFPDYWTQGTTLEDLQEHLRDLHNDLTAAAVEVLPTRNRRE